MHSRRTAVSLAAICVLAGLMLVLIDRLIIPYLEDKRVLVSRGWKEETWKVAQMSSFLRWKHPPGTCILSSDGIPVSERKSKSKRILVAGDSFTAGCGLPNINDVWWRALQRELISRGYNDVEVIGISGGLIGSTAGVLKQVELAAARYQPDAVLFGYVTDDPEDVVDGPFRVPDLKAYEPDGLSKVLIRASRSIFPNITDLATSWLQKTIDEKRSGPVHGFDNSSRQLEFLKAENLSHYQTTLNHMNDVMKQLNVPFFVVALPCVAGFFPEFDANRPSSEYIQVIHDFYKKRYDGITPSFKKANIRFLNLIEPYVGLLKTDPQLRGNDIVHVLCTTPVDGHPSSLVTHFYATNVADLLEKDYSLVLGAKTNVRKKFPLKINDWMPPNANVYKVSERKWVFAFPLQAMCQLNMPVRQAHVQLNFEMPTEIRNIKLQGAGLKRSTIWLTSVNRNEGYDRRQLLKLEPKAGAIVSWELPKEPWTETVNTIKISAEINGADNRLVVTF
jgi:hypothetical protein